MPQTSKLRDQLHAIIHTNITACVLKKPTGTGYAISYAFIDSATPATWPKQKSLSF